MSVSDPDLCRELACFLVRLAEHIHDAGEQDDRNDHAVDIGVAGEQRAELVDHEGDGIGKAALITDGEPGPLLAVHLTLDRADGCKAGRAEKVKDQEGIAGDAVKGTGKILIDRAVAAAIEDAQRTYDVLLSYKAGDGSYGSLPVAPA